MKLVYETTVIENVLNALNRLPIVGIQSAEILTYVAQELSNNKTVDMSEEESVTNNEA